jgi:AraC-like DNA-binding protein
MTTITTDNQTALATLSQLALGRLRSVRAEPRMERPHEDLLLLSHRQPSDHLPQVYDPVVCLIVSGAKEVASTDRRCTIEAGQFLVVTHDMPVVSRITRATPEEPYVAVILSVDRTVLTELRPHASAYSFPQPGGPSALTVGEAGGDLLDAFIRCLNALADPQEAQVLFPLAAREIHFRLLGSAAGQTLRHLSLGHRPADTVATAIAEIRGDLAAKLDVRSLGQRVGLSASALHHHFKEVTGTTPVQFQKQLRLLEARRLIQSELRPVTEAAFTVGYSSPTQFSREYRRAFGIPPSRDRLRSPA